MKTVIENNKPTYYYKLIENISHIKGGISILKQLIIVAVLGIIKTILLMFVH